MNSCSTRITPCLPVSFGQKLNAFRKWIRKFPIRINNLCWLVQEYPTELEPIINALRRVRDAYPFYHGAQQIQDTSYNDFVAVVEGLKKSKEMADFLFSKVHFEIDLTDAEAHPRGLFREILLQNYSVFDDLPSEIQWGCILTVGRIGPIPKEPAYLSSGIGRSDLELNVKVEDHPEPSVRIHTSHDDSDKGPEDYASSSTGNRISAVVTVIFHQRRNGTDIVIGELQSTKGMAWFQRSDLDAST